MDKITKAVLDYFLSDPLRFLGFTVLTLVALVIYLGLKSRREADAATKAEFQRILERVQEMKNELKLTVTEYKAASNNFSGQLHGLSFEFRESSKQMGATREVMATRMGEIKLQTEKLNQTAIKLLEMNKSINDLHGRVIIIDKNYETLISRLKERKP